MIQQQTQQHQQTQQQTQQQLWIVSTATVTPTPTSTRKMNRQQTENRLKRRLLHIFDNTNKGDLRGKSAPQLETLFDHLRHSGEGFIGSVIQDYPNEHYQFALESEFNKQVKRVSKLISQLSHGIQYCEECFAKKGVDNE